jgi:hypothetical protein
MPWSIGDVTLPFGPTDVSDDSDCQTESLPLDGDEAVVFATAPGIRVVTLTGYVCAVACPTKADLEADYCSVLRGYQGTVQVVVSPYGAYTGSWYIKKVAFTEQAEGLLARVGYTIVLWLGSSTEVIT